jgi:uncharacterized protein (TIGR01777 family)
MRILISGSSGFIGKHLTKFLVEKNHKVQFLTRNSNLSENKNIHYWEPDNFKLNKVLVEKSDVVICLNGKKIISPLRNKLREIKSSRYNPIETFISTFEECTKLPKLFISASACGFYGDRPSEILDENSQKGNGILSDISNEWENKSSLKNLRVVNLRFGNIIHNDSHMFKQLKKFCKIIGAKRINGGENFFPWISLLDTLRAIEHIIHDEKIMGPVNITSNNNLRFNEVFNDLNQVIKPFIKIPVPKILIKLFFGQIGVEALLNDQKVIPLKLQNAKFEWMVRTPLESLNSVL